MKNITLLICTVLLTLVMFGCASESQTLSVYSADYDLTELKAADLDDQELVEPYGKDKYDGFYCWVSKSNDYMDQPQRLVVYNGRAEDEMICKCMGSNGYFVGFNRQEFASGIHFFRYTGNVIPKDEYLAGSLLPTGRCVALLKDIGGHDICYAITTWNEWDADENSERVTLWRLNFPTEKNGDQYSAEKVCDIVEQETAIGAVLLPSGEILVATSSALYKVTTEGDVTQIEVPGKWEALCVNSMAVIENDVYIGTKYGVLSFQTQNNQFTWYPVDYSKIIVKKD